MSAIISSNEVAKNFGINDKLTWKIARNMRMAVTIMAMRKQSAAKVNAIFWPYLIRLE